ncbi:orf26 [Trichoplusia ni single nucleopolyhedrovirus]|uniref:Orf26 n=1 Tax=Trichoplusia ni single nucleopolyhedrovirus TaxID=332054 RepID=Q462D9_9ABAC|nr:orf26 [Trichoplusia ni single nucleopolyhedrovirus]AAZ67397.1 orf26 [Trichoplusia ni single nucleopolyhedrovirus]
MANSTKNCNNLVEIFDKYSDKLVFDKNNFENVNTTIQLLEKKKIKYRITMMPVYGDNGLEFTVAIILLHDKRIAKKTKKMISNNKYILFNSWYTKNKQSVWPNSHMMWNIMKSHSNIKPFVSIFDFMEKLGKSIEIDTGATIPEQTDSDTHVTEIDTNNVVESTKIDASNAKRAELYNEFYKVMNETFTSESAPSQSFLYEFKLKSGSDLGFERLTRNIIQTGVDCFKKLLETVIPSSSSEHKMVMKIHNNDDNHVAVSTKQQQQQQQQQRKRLQKTNNVSVNMKKSKQQHKSSTKSSTTYQQIVDDDFEESQMSSI